MQRRATKTTRGPNADEKRYQAWCKEHGCAWCVNIGPSIVDHCRGSTFKHNKTLIGHWFCLPQCGACDTQKTIHGKRLGNESDRWCSLIYQYIDDTGAVPPQDVHNSIMDWGR